MEEFTRIGEALYHLRSEAGLSLGRAPNVEFSALNADKAGEHAEAQRLRDNALNDRIRYAKLIVAIDLVESLNESEVIDNA